MALSIPNYPSRIAGSLKRLFSRSTFSPQKYWESRHQSLAGRLAAVGHAQLSESANQEQYSIKGARIGEALLRYFPEPVGFQLLDAGCGVGALTSRYVELGFDVTGVDFSASAIAAAQASGIAAHFKQLSLERLSLGQSFDVVCIVDVLQHLVDDDGFARALAGVASHVKLDGAVLVVDSMSDSGPSATHCHRRSLPWHEAEFRIVGLEMIEHSQFTLPHENSTKDLLVLKRRF